METGSHIPFEGSRNIPLEFGVKVPAQKSTFPKKWGSPLHNSRMSGAQFSFFGKNLLNLNLFPFLCAVFVFLSFLPTLRATTLPQVPLHQWVARDPGMPFSMSAPQFPPEGQSILFTLKSPDGLELKGVLIGAHSPPQSASVVVLDLAQSGPQSPQSGAIPPNVLAQTLANQGFHIILLEKDPNLQDALDHKSTITRTSQGDLVSSLKNRVMLRLLLVDWLEKQTFPKSRKPFWVSVEPQGFGVFQATRDPRLQKLVWINPLADSTYPDSFWASSFGFQFSDLVQGLGKRPLLAILPPSPPEQSPSWLLPIQGGSRQIWRYPFETSAVPDLSSQLPSLICSSLGLGQCPPLHQTLEKQIVLNPKPAFHKTRGSSLWQLLAPDSKIPSMDISTLSQGAKILLVHTPDEALAQKVFLIAREKSWLPFSTYQNFPPLPHHNNFESCCLVSLREQFLFNARRLRAISQHLSQYSPNRLVVFASGLGANSAMLGSLDNPDLNNLILFSPSIWFDHLLRKNPSLFGEKQTWSSQIPSRIRQELSLVDAFHLLPHLKPENWTLLGGMKDRNTPPDVVHHLANRLGMEARFLPVDQTGNEGLLEVISQELQGMSVD